MPPREHSTASGLQSHSFWLRAIPPRAAGGEPWSAAREFCSMKSVAGPLPSLRPSIASLPHWVQAGQPRSIQLSIAAKSNPWVDARVEPRGVWLDPSQQHPNSDDKSSLRLSVIATMFIVDK